MNFQHFQSCSPIIQTDRVAETAEYYELVLGFEMDANFRDEHYAMGWANEFQFFIVYAATVPVGNLAMQLCYPAIDELYEKHRSNQAKIIQPLTDQPYGLRDYRIEDINGHHLWFCSHIETHYKSWLASKR